MKITAWTLAAALFFTYSLMKLDLYLLQPYINTVSAVSHGQREIFYDESRFFDTAVELGRTKAIFCGHDHYNNQSLE